MTQKSTTKRKHEKERRKNEWKKKHRIKKINKIYRTNVLMFLFVDCAFPFFGGNNLIHGFL